MATDSQKCPFEIEGITFEERERNYKEIALVKGKNGCAARINVFKVDRDKKNVWPRIMLELTFEIGEKSGYPAKTRLYRELIGKYGGNSTDGKWIMGIDDSNEKDIIEEIEENTLLQNSLSELISDVMRYVYKYEAIREIQEKIDKTIPERWEVRSCFDMPYKDIGEADLVVDYNYKTKEYGRPYIDLTHSIDDKWKLWFYTRKDADNGNSEHTDEIIGAIAPNKLGNRVWRDGNGYVILDKFVDDIDWSSEEEREKFVSWAIERIIHWTEEIIAKYIDPQRTQSLGEPQNTTTETK